jgi:phosphoglycolate phosphatase-like HAD superfamily hydrolase
MFLNQYKNIFFDFDGVIKESLTVKAEAFEELFLEYGVLFRKKVWEHHMKNGGLSRIDKIKLYMSWADEDIVNSRIDELSCKFEDLVKDKVIQSDWVPGVDKFLKAKKDDQIFIIVSAAPQQELQEICNMIGISKVFSRIYGSPISKTKAIRDSIINYSMDLDDCVIVGDYNNDLVAARNNRITFVLRAHEFNQHVKVSSNIRIIRNFLNQ